MTDKDRAGGALERAASLERELRALPPGPTGRLELLEERQALEQALATLDPGERGGLERALERIDRLGRQRIGAFLSLNPARRAALARLGGAAGWWWGLRVECDPAGLAALSAGLLDSTEREELQRHLGRCADCREELRWLGELDPVLSTPDGEHLSPADLVAHAAGEGEAGWRRAVAGHLASCAECQRLARGAGAGLDEAGRVEAGLALLAAREGGGPEVADAVHLPLALDLPRAPRALAADPAPSDGPPLPRERRVLLVAGDHTLVLWVEAGRVQLALFAAEPGRLPLSVTVEGRPVPASESTPEARRHDLGPAGRLAGKTLVVELGQVHRSWTLVLDESETEER